MHFVLALLVLAAPDVPAVGLCRAFAQHLGGDDATQLSTWLTARFSRNADAQDRDEFVKSALLAREESGGVDVVSVRPGRTPGNGVMTLRSRRERHFAIVVLTVDPADSDKVLRGMIAPTEDPELYAGWTSALDDAQLTARVRSALDRLVKTSDFSGCITVARGGKTLVDACRGLADRTFSVAAGPATKFHIGSMDKMFTAVAIAQLVQQGRLSWDATLAQLVPEYPDHEAAQQITVWQLLHHQAGLGDFFVPEFFQNREKFVNPADYLALIAKQPKPGAPGKQWAYSNAGYILLGRIIEKVSGQGYFDYVKDHVFAPAKMDATGFDSLEDVVPGVAVGYLRDDPFALAPWKANWMTLPFKGSPAGGGYSTTHDLLRFADALRGGKLVSKATLARMFEDGVPVGHEAVYAAGFEDRAVGGVHVRGHNGGAPGMNAALAFLADGDAAVAVTSNEDGPAAQNLADHIADVLAAR